MSSMATDSPGHQTDIRAVARHFVGDHDGCSAVRSILELTGLRFVHHREEERQSLLGELWTSWTSQLERS